MYTMVNLFERKKAKLSAEGKWREEKNFSCVLEKKRKREKESKRERRKENMSQIANSFFSLRLGDLTLQNSCIDEK